MLFRDLQMVQIAKIGHLDHLGHWSIWTTWALKVLRNIIWMKLTTFWASLSIV